MKKTTAQFLSILLACCLVSCCAPPLKKEVTSPEEALRQVRFFYPRFRDDIKYQDLERAVNYSLEYLDRLKKGSEIRFGPDTFEREEVIESHRAFLEIISGRPDPGELNRRIKRTFRVYRATGRAGEKEILFTGYFEPIYRASSSAGGPYRYPIYDRPSDMLEIDLAQFHPRFSGQKLVARVEGNRVLPYYSRREIDTEGCLRGRGLEIAWLRDPVDVAFLQIQGSGSLLLPDGHTMRVGFLAKNGLPYRSIGRYMIKKGMIPKEKVSMQAIRRYLESHRDIVPEVLNYNPSYVFFRRLSTEPQGNLGVPLTPGRSIALDYRLFPKGALGFIETRKPLLDEDKKIKEWRKFSRFVLNQDTGGAIKGAGRADIFWGRGPYAETAAGHMRHEGDLFILIKK